GAAQTLVDRAYQPLLAGGTALLDTLTTYLEQGSSLEATARMLFVHPNTVRYRLRRVTELTGYAPSDGRDGVALWVGVVPRGGGGGRGGGGLGCQVVRLPGGSAAGSFSPRMLAPGGRAVRLPGCRAAWSS